MRKISQLTDDDLAQHHKYQTQKSIVCRVTGLCVCVCVCVCVLMCMYVWLGVCCASGERALFFCCASVREIGMVFGGVVL